MNKHKFKDHDYVEIINWGHVYNNWFSSKNNKPKYWEDNWSLYKTNFNNGGIYGKVIKELKNYSHNISYLIEILHEDRIRHVVIDIKGLKHLNREWDL